MKTIVVGVVFAALVFGCKSNDLTPEDCRRIAALTSQVVQVVAEDATEDEEKKAQIKRYTELLKSAANLGCAFIPEPLPDAPPEE